jgi:hypothetical protein
MSILSLFLTPQRQRRWFFNSLLAVTKTGFTPARLCDIAKPHPRPDPFLLLSGLAQHIGFGKLPNLSNQGKNKQFPYFF